MIGVMTLLITDPDTVTEPLSSETTFATHLLFGDSNGKKSLAPVD